MNPEIWDLMQGPDDARDPHGLHVEFVCFEPNVYGDAMFVTIRCRSGAQYLGQIEGTQLNLNRDSLGKYENSTFNQLEELRHGRIDPAVILKLLSLYKVRLVKDVSGQMPMGIKRRPLAGSAARAATEQEIVDALGLPSLDARTIIGQISGTTIDLCVDTHTLINHIGVAGSTGSGKSNLLANLLTSASALGFYTIVYDHKPDYHMSHEPNDDGSEEYYTGLKNVTYWRLEEGRGRDIRLPASVLDLGVLAHTLLYKPSEKAVAVEEAERLLLAFIAEMRPDRDEPFGILDFVEWYDRGYSSIINTLNMHKNTAEALRRKLKSPSRRPAWIAEYAGSGMLGRGGMFDMASLAKPGHVTVIDVRAKSSGQVGRSYGLFLSYALREAGNLRNAGFKAPILHVIDEAQDIFDAGSAFRDAAGDMMNDFVRKGRSQKIGFVIGVQSADSVPDQIRNNLNSQVIMRHRRLDSAKAASAILSDEQRLQTATFGPGECFVDLVGASSVVRCQARRSPFRLSREDD